MNKRGPIEVEKARTLKAARSFIRLKHSLAADQEINDRLPDLEMEMDAAIQAGKPFELDLRSILEDS